jgi:hypothetical protein
MKNQESIVRTKENNKVKYVCNFCDYITYRKSNIEKHFDTIKHKLKIATKSSKIATKSSPKVATKNQYFCELCNYKTYRVNNFERHCSGKPHQEKVSTSEQQVSTSEGCEEEKTEYFCEVCNYKTKRSNNFERHCSGKPHQEKVSTSEQQVSTSEHQVSRCEGSENGENFDEIDNRSLVSENMKIYKCQFCDKQYKYASGLTKHKQKCESYGLQKRINDELDMIKKELKELSNKPYVINNNNNTMNNTVNIETFLNTECSGAMNFLDFIQNLTITQDDIIRMSKTGFIRSYGELVTQKIKDMDIKDRPAHCTNKRQMLFFLKHNNIWTDDKDFKIFNKSINLLKDKECEEWYNYSVREREKNYVSDADVNNRANAINEIAKMNDETLFTKIIKKASTELFLSKKDL